uniref:COesterase domain-containing protein n=1 Tax=Caenorhabditis japonica TaxID=281687 RepID=A0A8R1EMB0_CAEJA
MLNGDRHVRIYQFTHVSEVGRNTVPDTGANWKPVFKGQDMYFITMSETIWSNSSYTAQDRQVADQMGQRWSDFVKTGQVANWDTTSQQNYNYCNLNTQATQQAHSKPGYVKQENGINPKMGLSVSLRLSPLSYDIHQ